MNRGIQRSNWTKCIRQYKKKNSWAVQWTEVLISIAGPTVKHFQNKEEITRRNETINTRHNVPVHTTNTGGEVTVRFHYSQPQRSSPVGVLTCRPLYPLRLHSQAGRRLQANADSRATGTLQTTAVLSAVCWSGRCRLTWGILPMCTGVHGTQQSVCYRHIDRAIKNCWCAPMCTSHNSRSVIDTLIEPSRIADVHRCARHTIVGLLYV